MVIKILPETASLKDVITTVNELISMANELEFLKDTVLGTEEHTDSVTGCCTEEKEHESCT